MTSVAIVDYGVGNLLSLRRALERCAATVTLAADADAIAAADRIVLPGVGAFGHAAGELRRRGLDQALLAWVARQRPLLGICVGMQMLMDHSEEFGRHDGLGLIAGAVVPVPATGADGTPHPIPHICWNGLLPPPGRAAWPAGLLDGIAPGDAVYFVHSFMAAPVAAADVMAIADYDGQAVTAAIGRGNVAGCQFHPEKSGEVGLKILRRFLAL